jgi:PleD family two-component response regulator
MMICAEENCKMRSAFLPPLFIKSACAVVRFWSIIEQAIPHSPLQMSFMSASDPSPSGPQAEGVGAPRRQRILMIDDDQALTSVVKMALEGTGEYEVLAEHEPVRAVATARKFQPDLILLDLIMPQLDGGDVSLDLTHDPALAR